MRILLVAANWNRPSHPGKRSKSIVTFDSVLASEVIQEAFRRGFPSEGRTPDQQDAYAAAEWVRRADCDGSLERFLCPTLEPHERKTAEIVRMDSGSGIS